ISKWMVEDFAGAFCAPGVNCSLGAGSGCRPPAQGEPGVPEVTIICDRTSAGVTVRAGGGDDTVDLLIESDPATVDLGAGNDVLESPAVPGQDRTMGQNITVAQGTWTVFRGDGSDRIEGSAGG